MNYYARQQRNGRIWKIVITATVLVGASVVLYFAIPRKVNATITQTNWIYRTNIRQKTPAHNEGWGHPGTQCSAPGFCEAPFNVTCESRYYGTEDCFCHSCNCHQNSHGSTSCSTCCSQCPVYKDWCNYDYFAWPVVRSVVEGGTDHSVRWPVLDPDPSKNERAERLEEYAVRFAEVEGERHWGYEPRSLGDYNRFNTRDSWLLKVHPGFESANPLKILTAEAE